MNFFKKPKAETKSLQVWRENVYDRAVGQHLHKSATSHKDPCRYNDFESKGRASDF